MNASTYDIEELYKAGMHCGFLRARRHPSAERYIFATKERSDMFDLEETRRKLDAASAFVFGLAASGKQILFVGGKHEAREIVRAGAERAGMPYSAGRWIGGTLTNFKNIRKRVDRLEKLVGEREEGALEKYTKRERLLLGREIEELQARFGGIVALSEMPAALFVVDTRHEDTAVREANQLGIPVVGLSGSDCDFALVQYPIPGNDTSVASIRFVMEAIVESCLSGARAQGKDKASEVHISK